MMNGFQRLRSILFALLMLALAVLLLFVPNEGYYIIAIVLGISILVYGIRLMVFYFTMARNMVGGRSILNTALIVLDLGLLTLSISVMNSLVILFYLIGFYAFSGGIDILRGMEVKNNGGTGWKFKVISGGISIVLVLLLVVVGLFMGNKELLVYGYSISLFYSAVIKIISAFQRTTMVYIQ